MREIGGFLRKEDKKVWFDFDGARVQIRRLDVKDLVNIKRRATVGKGKKERLDVILHNKYLSELSVIGWEGMVDDGKPVAFSQEALQTLMIQDVDFASFVNETVTNFADNVAGEGAESEKNSESTSD